MKIGRPGLSVVCRPLAVQDRDGNDRYTTEIVADNMQMLGGRGGGASAQPMDRGGSSRPAATPQPASEFEDDEIPF